MCIYLQKKRLVGKIVLKSTFCRVCVVQFSGMLGYNEAIEQHGGIDMNTDKIYAEKVASEYAPSKTSKVSALKRLDRKAKAPASIFAYTFGIIAALLLGVGMCLTMKVIGNGSTGMYVLGIVVGVLGIAMASVNYPIYKKILDSSKKKYAGDIIELAKQISEEQD